MVDLILTTFDWVPETPRGYVRDIRVRWALEEASLPYRVESVPFGDRNAGHFSHQPFGQVPWSLFQFSGDTETPGFKMFDDFLKTHRLKHLEPVLEEHEWLAASFSIADILMADVLRLVDRFDRLAGYPACRDYVARATERPAFVKAHADQMAHFAAAD